MEVFPAEGTMDMAAAWRLYRDAGYQCILMLDHVPQIDARDPHGVRDLIGDGSFGGLYGRPDGDMLRLWSVAVAETRALLEGPWE
jgi:hypothetical protein